MFYSKTTGGFYNIAIHGDNIPADAVKITTEQHAQLLSDQSAGATIQPDNTGYPVAVFPPPPTVAEIEQAAITALTAAVQKHLDDTAKQRNYDGIAPLCTYTGSSNQQFAAEGRAGVAWRDASWTICLQAISDIKAGKRSMPTAEELILELPALVWP